MLSSHLDKNNLHHAYLIEGAHDDVLPELHTFMAILEVPIVGNPDFTSIRIDNFKIDEALELRAMAEQKSFGDNKKIFIVSVNNFPLEAQQILLKMFEEPIRGTHLFLIIPDVNVLLPTLRSRFYSISQDSKHAVKEAEKFLAMSQSARMVYLKDFLAKEDEDEEVAAIDSTRSKSLRFLNDLESILQKKVALLPSEIFNHIFQVRKFLRQPGSSTKNLMESLALIIPVI